MFTKAPWEVTGGYLEGNYNMGGTAEGVGHNVDELTKAVNTGSGGRTGQTDLKSQGRDIDIHNQRELGKIQSGETTISEENAFKVFGDGVIHAINEAGNFVMGDPRGYNKKVAQEREAKEAAEKAALAAKAAGQTYGQEGKKKKKKKGLLALSTPSAQAGRFRSGKRRFRVRPTGATGVNVAGSSGGSTVGTS